MPVPTGLAFCQLDWNERCPGLGQQARFKCAHVEAFSERIDEWDSTERKDPS